MKRFSASKRGPCVEILDEALLGVEESDSPVALERVTPLRILLFETGSPTRTQSF